MSDPDALSYPEVLSRIGGLAEVLADHDDPSVAATATELLDWIDAFHRDGLGRLVEMIRAWRGEIFLDSAEQDDVVGVLLGAYGLGDSQGVQATAGDLVAAALDQVRPLVESHGGSVEVASVRDGVVQVRMGGTCDGCPSASATLVYGVEAALREHWVHFRKLEVVDPPATGADPDKAALVCVTVPAPTPPPAQWQAVELRRPTGDRDR